MNTTTALDVTNPASANALGGDLATTTLSLTQRLALEGPITSLEALEQAATDRRTLGDAAKQIEAFFKPIKDMAYKLHRAICDRENAVLGPVLQRDAAHKAAITAFNDEQVRVRRQAERDEADRRHKEQQERATHEAAALEQAGETRMADAVLADAIAAPPPVVVLPDPVKAIVSFRRTWKWRYTTDEARAVELLPRAYLMVDVKKLNAYATAFKTSAALPGIQVYPDDTPTR